MTSPPSAASNNSVPDHEARGSERSYGQILRSSSIIGGAQGLNYLIGLLRMKAVAVLLGPSGVGLVGVYVSMTSLVSMFSQLGIDQSGVREVADANGSGDPDRIARVVNTLRRACWITGTLGWIIAAALAWPLSQWTFGSTDRVWAVAILGVTVLIGALAGGETALLQGMRRVGDLARIQVLSSLLTTLLALGLYGWLRERGIVPVIVLTALINLGFSWCFSRRMHVREIAQSWVVTVYESKRLIMLGAAFMYGAVLAAAVGLIIRAIVVRELGLDASGIYQAAWGLSGMFAGFILGAMGADFYPRLTAVAADDERVNQLVNEQIEVGMLLALPGLLATIALAPLLMQLFYSAKFEAGAELLPWLTAGVFGQVLTFPLGFIQRAKGKARWILVSQTHLNLLHLLLAVLLIKTSGLVAAAWAFAATTYLHGIVVFLIARRLSGFQWARSTSKLALAVASFLIFSLALQSITTGAVALVMGTIAALLGAVFALRNVAPGLNPQHRLVQLLRRSSVLRFACKL